MVVDVVVDDVEVEEAVVLLVVVVEAEVVVPEVDVMVLGDSVVVTTSLELPYVSDFNNVAPAPIKRALLITIRALFLGFL